MIKTGMWYYWLSWQNEASDIHELNSMTWELGRTIYMSFEHWYLINSI